MPTAAQFRDTARELDALGEASGFAHYGITTIGTDIGVRGGGFEAGLQRGLDTTALNVRGLMTRCSDEATEARRRAGVCDQYTEDLRIYREQLATWDDLDPGTAPKPPRPQEPARPASWADAG